MLSCPFFHRYATLSAYTKYYISIRNSIHLCIHSWSHQASFTVYIKKDDDEVKGSRKLCKSLEILALTFVKIMWVRYQGTYTYNFLILAVFLLQNKEPIFLLKWIRRREWRGLLIILEVHVPIWLHFRKTCSKNKKESTLKEKKLERN